MILVLKDIDALRILGTLSREPQEWHRNNLCCVVQVWFCSEQGE